MEKLIEKFEKINGRMLSQHGNAISSAEEARKLAIEFANYCNSSGDCSELFEQFINKYYE